MSRDPIDARDEPILADDFNLADAEWEARAPHTTLILACYRVEEYLPEFLASLDAQTADHSGYEVIFVIDGCPERSEDVVREWAADSDYAVRIVVKRNGGVASARIAGIARARGAWISSPDPDDRLAPGYLAEIESARAEHPEELMFVGRIRLQDPQRRDIRHPLDSKYAGGGRRVVDLLETPDDIQTLGGTVFFSAERITEHRQRVREDLPTASDADFIMRYLLLNGARYVLVPSAEYCYQRRVDASSIVKTQERNIARFTTVFGVTHRALLESAGPECPQWLANTLLYFTFYLFRRNRQTDSPVYGVAQEILDEIRAEITENLRRMGVDRIEAFRIFDVPLDVRMAWLAAARPGLRRSPVERLSGDPAVSLRVGFYSDAQEAPSDLEAGGAEIREAKARRVEYLGTTWTYQHILRLSPAEPGAAVLSSSDGFVFELGGRPFTAAEIRAKLGQSKPRGAAAPQPSAPVPSRASQLRRAIARLRYSVPLRLAAVTGYGRRFAGAWVFSDEAGGASWLPEMCRSLHEARPDAPNIWCVVDTAPDRRAFRGLRTVRSGSVRHFILMKHARLLVATGLSPRERQPFPAGVLARTWRFVYLPPDAPGLRDYRRINPLQIDAIAADDHDEGALYASDGGDYRFLPSEVVLLPGYRRGTIRGEEAREAFETCSGMSRTD
jgi:glycosyltransferase involved in cell wall biosynthesis